MSTSTEPTSEQKGGSAKSEAVFVLEDDGKLPGILAQHWAVDEELLLENVSERNEELSTEELVKGLLLSNEEVDRASQRRWIGLKRATSSFSDWESVDSLQFIQMGEVEVARWLKSAQKRFDIKDDVIKAIAARLTHVMPDM